MSDVAHTAIESVADVKDAEIARLRAEIEALGKAHRNADRCARCGKPILGPYSETMLGRVHGATFVECANVMDAPDGPRCACGKPSAFESGDCFDCGEDRRQ